MADDTTTEEETTTNDDLEERVAALETLTSEMSESISTLETSVTELASTAEETQTLVDNLTDSVSTISDNLTTISSTLDTLSASIETLTTSVDSLSDRVTALENTAGASAYPLTYSGEQIQTMLDYVYSLSSSYSASTAKSCLSWVYSLSNNYSTTALAVAQSVAKTSPMVKGTVTITTSSDALFCYGSLSKTQLGFTPSSSTKILAAVRHDATTVSPDTNITVRAYRSGSVIYLCLHNYYDKSSSGYAITAYVPAGTYYVDYLVLAQ